MGPRADYKVALGQMLHEVHQTLGTVFDFLGVERLPPIPSQETHARPYVRQMSRREWTYLHDVFEVEIRALERMLAWDCAEWLHPPDDLANET